MPKMQEQLDDKPPKRSTKCPGCKIPTEDHQWGLPSKFCEGFEKSSSPIKKERKEEDLETEELQQELERLELEELAIKKKNETLILRKKIDEKRRSIENLKQAHNDTENVTPASSPANVQQLRQLDGSSPLDELLQSMQPFQAAHYNPTRAQKWPSQLPPSLSQETMDQSVMFLRPGRLKKGVCCLVFPRCSIATSPSNLPLHVEKSGCPQTKGCFSFPEDCKSSQDCDYLVTYVPGKENVMFSVSAKDEYVALGFNDEPEMDGTDTVICFKETTGCTIAHFNLVGYDKPKYSPADSSSLRPEGMQRLNVSYEDGAIKCRFQRQKAPTKDMKYDLNKKLYLIFASGKASDKFIKEHSWKDTSWKKVNVSTPIEMQSTEFNLLLAHAGLMFLAWIGFATVGIFTSRYRKSFWGEKKLFNSDVWFRVHQVCMLITILLSVVGIIVIFVHVGSFAKGAHPIIGIFIVAFMVAQPVMAFFRPEPQAYSRFLFNWIHRLVGLFSVAFAILNCYLGINMVDELKVRGNIILSVFVAIMVLVIVLYEVFLFRNTKPLLSPFSVDCNQDDVQISTPADQVVHEEPVTPQTTTDKRDLILRNVVYYFVVTLCVLSCLGFFIVLGTVA